MLAAAGSLGERESEDSPSIQEEEVSPKRSWPESKLNDLELEKPGLQTYGLAITRHSS